MSRKDAYIEGAGLAQRSDRLASHWNLELQDTLLDVAAAMAATEPAPAKSVAKPAERIALTRHWTLREPAQRKN